MKRSPLDFSDSYAGEPFPVLSRAQRRERWRTILAAVAVVVISALSGIAIAGVAYLYTVQP